MKKLLIAGAIAAITLAGTTACNNSSSADATLNDSISTLLGQSQGAQLNASYATLPETERATMSKEDILAGIKAVLMADTSNHGYITGLNIGMNMLQGMGQMESQGINIDHQKFFNALSELFKTDSVSQDKLIELQSTLEPLMHRAQEAGMAEVQARMEAERKAREEAPEAKANVTAGEKYVADLKAKDPEIKTTDSGLSYKITQAGTGDSPAANDMVTVKYTGRLINGEEFDSSNGETVDFPVAGVVPGFGEALQLMKKGEKMTIYIPGKLAYGVDGIPGKIGPMEMLVFDVELVDFKAPGAAN